MDMTLTLPDRFVRAYPPVPLPDGDALWVAFVGDEVVVEADARGDAESLALPRGSSARGLARLLSAPPVVLGSLDGVSFVGAQISEPDALPDPLITTDLRGLHGRLPSDLFAVVGYAYQIVRWQRGGHFCGFCGSATEPVQGEWGRRCESCNHVAYPHVAPCVIALIHDGGGRIVLAHRRGRGPMMSLVAGFVEPGESLESALIREVREEVGLEVDAIRYFASQPWPFPHQLMVGFFARHADGEIRPDGDELDHAAWYNAEDLQRVVLPGPISIARRLMDTHLASRRRDAEASSPGLRHDS